MVLLLMMMRHPFLTISTLDQSTYETIHLVCCCDTTHRAGVVI